MAGYDGYGMPAVDFSLLGKLPEIYKRAQLEDARKLTLAQLGQGTSVGDTAKALFGVGDIEGGLSLARLADAQALREYNMQRDARDFGLRKTEIDRTQANTDRSFGLQREQLDATLQGSKIPAGFRPKPDGGLEPVPGGATDPDYIARANAAKEKPRQMSVTDITKLTEEGGKFNNVTGFVNTFEPRFAGLTVGGDLRNWAGSNLPSAITGADARDSAAWWQEYDRAKNVVRHELYGAALTPTEKTLFEKADINPNMNPDQVKRNLLMQERIIKNGIKRKANALIQAGYDPSVIGSSYGLDLGEIGVTAQPKRPGVAPAPAPAPIPPGQSANFGGEVLGVEGPDSPKQKATKRYRFNPQTGALE